MDSQLKGIWDTLQDQVHDLSSAVKDTKDLVENHEPDDSFNDFMDQLYDLIETANVLCEDINMYSKDIENEYHGVNYQTGYEDGINEGYTQCMNDSPGFDEVKEQILKACEGCTKAKTILNPNPMCALLDCNLFPIAEQWSKAYDWDSLTRGEA